MTDVWAIIPGQPSEITRSVKKIGIYPSQRFFETESKTMLSAWLFNSGVSGTTVGLSPKRDRHLCVHFASFERSEIRISVSNIALSFHCIGGIIPWIIGKAVVRG